MCSRVPTPEKRCGSQLLWFLGSSPALDPLRHAPKSSSGNTSLQYCWKLQGVLPQRQLKWVWHLEQGRTKQGGVRARSVTENRQGDSTHWFQKEDPWKKMSWICSQDLGVLYLFFPVPNTIDRIPELLCIAAGTRNTVCSGFMVIDGLVKKMQTSSCWSNCSAELSQGLPSGRLSCVGTAASLALAVGACLCCQDNCLPRCGWRLHVTVERRKMIWRSFISAE